MRLVINADDFGYSKGVNLGILEAYQNGVVSSTTMMTNMPGAAHAAALALDHPQLGVGIHIVLDCGKPVNENVPSLVDENGYFYKTDKLIQHAELSDIEKEIRSQIDKFRSFGLDPTHLDSHHHVHGHEKIYPLVEKIAQEYQLPVRKVSADPNHSSNLNLKSTNYFFHQFYGNEITAELLVDLIDKSTAYNTSEIMCHPAYIDESLLKGSSYSLERTKELAILTEPAVQRAIIEKNIQLVTYRDVCREG